jgi:thioesterase domain-containing protein/acyl carrier protein
VTGELYLGGDGVARGYRGQTGLTKEVFLKDPYSDKPGATMYRSGDLGSLGRDGNLRFYGRVDRQIKVRGFRIEPAEIEAALCSLPHVRECLVEAAGDPGDDPRLIAYLVLDPGQSLDAPTMRSSLRAILPAYMIPNHFLSMERLPLGATGKRDVKGLPHPKTEDGKWPIMAFCKYRSIHEVIVREIFEELLETKDIGPEDDFFEKGGHSLQLLRLASRIYEVFGVPLDIRLLFPSPSVSRVCQAIAFAEGAPSMPKQGPEESLPFVVPVKKHGSKPPVFLVPGGTGDDFSLAMYGRLAVFLPDDTPMYGFRTRDAEERWLVPYTSVEEMASAFIGGIRVIQPYGPYRITGGCIGGVIAYEIARQLAESGDVVERLVLLEAWPPDLRGYLRMIKRNWCSRARFFMEDNLLRGDPIGSFGKNMREIAPGMRNRVISLGPGIYRWIQVHLPWEWEDIPNEVRTEWSTFHRMVLRYTPKPYPGEAVVIESKDSFRKGASNAWRPFVRTVKTIYVPGNHLTYLTEKIREWGAQFGDLFR